MLNYLLKRSQKIAGQGRVTSLLILALSQLVGSWPVQGATFAWDASPDPTVTGYNFYYGTNASVLTTQLNVGTNTVATVTNLNAGMAYYFAVTAFNLVGTESLPTAEIEYDVPAGVGPVIVPPVLAPFTNQFVNVQQNLVITDSASESNLPPQNLSFSLVAAPAGMQINSASGMISWTPTLAQAGSVNPVTVQVSDNRVPPLAASQSFTVVVGNVAQISLALAPVASQTVNMQQTLWVTNSASESGLTAQNFSFRLVSGPFGMNINSTSGLISWTPAIGRAGSLNPVTVQVSDNRTPPLTASQSFTVAVSDVALITLNDASLTVGQSGIVPLTLNSSGAVTNLSFTLDAPAGWVTRLTVQSLLPGVAIVSQVPVGAVHSVITVQATNGQALQGLQKLLQINFGTCPSSPAAIGLLQASSVIAVLANGNLMADAPNASSRMTFAVPIGAPPVRAQISLADASVTLGQSGSVPLFLASGGALTNLSFTLDAPAGWVNGLTVQSLLPGIAVVSQTPVGAAHSVITVQTTNGQMLQGQQTLLQINFTTLAGPPSGTGSLQASNVTAVLVNGQPALTAPNASSQLIFTAPIVAFPSLAPIASQTVNMQQTLLVTNSASESGLTAQNFSFRLVSGPVGMNINSTNGIISWTPNIIQAGSANPITVRVSDNRTPPLTASQSFTVAVSDVALITLNDASLTVGQSGIVPLTLNSSGAMTNLSFTLDAPAGWVTRLSVQSLLPGVAIVSQMPVGAVHSVITVQATNGQALQGLQKLLQINFATSPNQPANVGLLQASGVTAVLANGQSVSYAPNASSQMTFYGPNLSSTGKGTNPNPQVSEAQPMPNPQADASVVDSFLEFYLQNGRGNLTLHGQVGASYEIQSTTNQSLSGTWTSEFSTTLTNSTQIFPNLPLTEAGMKFYRAHKL